MNKAGTGGDTEQYISAALMDSFADYEKWVAALTTEGYANVVSKRTVASGISGLSLRPGTESATTSAAAGCKEVTRYAGLISA